MNYNAFISYSQTEDQVLASKLQNELHRIMQPWHRLRPSELNIFRDATDLTPARSLPDSIKNGIANSDYFILLASPKSSQSKWVIREVELFLEKCNNKRIDPSTKIIIVLTKGEIRWNTETNSRNLYPNDALPEIINNLFTEEPLWIDFREIKKGKNLNVNRSIFKIGVVRIAAALLNIKPADIDSKQIKDKKKVRWMIIFTLIILVGLIGLIYLKINEANNERGKAYARLYYTKAIQLRDNDPEKALRIAHYSYKSYPDTQASNLMSHLYKRLKRKYDLFFIKPKVNIEKITSLNNSCVTCILKDSSIYSWDAKQNERFTFKQKNCKFYDARPKEDDYYIIGTKDDISILIFKNGEQYSERINVNDSVSTAGISKHSKYIYAISKAGNAVILSIDASPVIEHSFNNDTIIKMEISSNEDQYVIETKSCKFVLYDIHGKEIMKHQNTRDVFFSSSGDYVLSINSKEDSVYIWSTDGTLVKSIFHERADMWPQISGWYALTNYGPLLARMSHDNQLILTAQNDGKIYIHHLYSEKTDSINASQDAIQSVSFSNDDKMILAGLRLGQIKVWKLGEAEELIYFKPKRLKNPWSSAPDFPFDLDNVYFFNEDKFVIADIGGQSIQGWYIHYQDWLQNDTTTQLSPTEIDNLLINR